VSRGQQILDDEDEGESLGKLTSLLEKLAQRYSSHSLPADLGFDPADNWDRKTEEGLKRCLKVAILFNNKCVFSVRERCRFGEVKGNHLKFFSVCKF
jgi:hypothetical protein